MSARSPTTPRTPTTIRSVSTRRRDSDAPPAATPTHAGPHLTPSASQSRPAGSTLTHSTASSSKAALPLSSTPTTPLTTAPSSPQPVSINTKPTREQRAMRVPEKRVLPARIRRAAGTGQEGMRDLEEMVVDWLERFGEPSTTPPDTLPLLLTTVPLSLLSPPPSTVTSQAAVPEMTVTVTPTRATQFEPLVSPRGVAHQITASSLDKSERIETPSWVLVRPGEDDAEEAREELSLGRGGGALNGRGALSPVKRLRKPLDDMLEDTSDSYYISLHRKYQVFERRQRIREKEKLQFERYKMRSRIELLRNMPKAAWAKVVSAIFARTDESGRWERGKIKVQEQGAEWLKRRLLLEGAEVMQRYEELLPSEHKKTQGKGTDGPTWSSARTSTSHSSQHSVSRSLSPVPVPPRVAALRVPVSKRQWRHSRKASLSAESADPEAHGDDDVHDGATPDRGRHRPSRVARSQSGSKGKRKRSEVTDPEGEHDDAGPAQRSLSTSGHQSTSSGAEPELEGDLQPQSQHVAQHEVKLERSEPARRSRHHSPFFPPLTSSGLPCLVEAASRREGAQAELVESQARAAAAKQGKRTGRALVREKTRTSGRLGTIAPFGLPVPPVVEWKSEFTLTDEPDFWPVIAERQEQANAQRRQSLLLLASAGLDGLGLGRAETASAPSVSMGISSEDVADMREVEAAVVL